VDIQQPSSYWVHVAEKPVIAQEKTDDANLGESYEGKITKDFDKQFSR